MDTLKFISRQIWVSREMDELGVRGLSKQRNGVQRPDYVTSLVGTPRNVSREKYDWARRSPNIPQKVPKLKVIMHVYDFPGTGAPDSMRCLLRTWEVIEKESCGLEQVFGSFTFILKQF